MNKKLHYEDIITSGQYQYLQEQLELSYTVKRTTRNDNNHNILICAIYRSPSYNESEFFDIFEEIIEEISDNNWMF